MKTWWLARTRPERLILIVCLVAIPIELVVKAICHSTSFGDFNVHREFGRRFLAGEPLYKNYSRADRIFCYNYMPISGLYYSPLAMVPAWAASLLRTGSAMACLALTFHWLGGMIRGRGRSGPWPGLALGAWAVLLTIQYVVRDLDDGGPHLIYLALIVGSVECVRRGREGLAAAGFGLSIALKMAPGLFLPYFLWKRRWRLAGLSTAWTLAWIVLPAAWMGPSHWWDHQQQWNKVAFSVFSDSSDVVRRANEIRVQNQSLKMAVQRYLVDYPAGHPLQVDHPLEIAFFRINPATAARISTLAGLGVLLAVAWWSRRPDAGPDDPARPVETAAILVLIPLLSPVTWLQHLVFVLPAVYLLVAEHRRFRPLGRSEMAALGLFAFAAIALNREILGQRNSLWLLSLHVHTFAMLALLLLLMARRPTERRAEVEAVKLTSLPSRPHEARWRSALGDPRR